MTKKKNFLPMKSIIMDSTLFMENIMNFHSHIIYNICFDKVCHLAFNIHKFISRVDQVSNSHPMVSGSIYIIITQELMNL